MNDDPLDFVSTRTRATGAAYRSAAPTKAAGPSLLATFFVNLAAVFFGMLAALLVAGFLAFGAASSFFTMLENSAKLEQQKIEHRSR